MLQELAGRLGRAMLAARRGERRLEVPSGVDRPLRFLKYAVLAVFVALSAALGRLAIRPYDPWAAWNHLIAADLLTGFLVGFLVLAGSLLGSLLFDRLFCKYLCPMGAFLALLRPLGWFRQRRNAATCTHCYACDNACPVNIRVEALSEVRSLECIDCNLCVSACPVPETLRLGGPGGRGRASAGAALWTAVALFAVVIGATSLTGGFQWTMRPLAEEVARSGSFDPGQIKGSDTFQAVSQLTGIPREEFLERFRISAQEFAGPIRDAAHRASGGFETEEVREFVRERLGR